ncbi:hypothetical protein CROQUDRAFT_43702 [Cronartium quercuum f. sp. fusiforme G11]|uniref:Septin-type G domain-containing protein n=1 Tax=Cronartium quercuum f. sp. fusiforme G11 TaxID=708437 RepID=A0A9P6NJW8_9BASI|nr:hypothetical protein CROQUDRAFT_43702 [Cronartium quercuum f. sp. fusiforme G11]
MRSPSKSSSSLHQITSSISTHHYPPLPNHHLYSSTTTFSRPTNISSTTTTSQLNHDLYTSPSRPGLRKSRQHPTFNLILVGSKETGKTGFVNNLFGSFGAYAPPDFGDQDKKLNKSPTDTFREYAAGHVPGLTGERVVLSVVDTPGLDIQSNDELVVEHQVNEIIHYLEEKFDGSLQLERQVKREPVRLGDTHIHCCLYFLHPSVLEPALRASQSQQINSKQSTTTTTRARLAMMNMDIRAMRRISKRTNVFPVIGRADELTVAQLTEIRNWIRSEMRGQNIDLSVLTGSTESDSASDEPDAVTTASSSSSSSSLLSSSTGASPESVPRLKQRRSFAVTPKKVQLVLNMTRAEQELNTLLPLALVSTEDEPEALGTDAIMALNRIDPLSGPGPDRSRLIGDHGYVRRFKWATLDLLDPNHCDFVLLRAVLMGTHLARLKDSTLEKVSLRI